MVYLPCSKTRASLPFIVFPLLYVGFMRRQMEEKHTAARVYCRRVQARVTFPPHFPSFPSFHATFLLASRRFDTREYPTRSDITRRNYGILRSTFSYSAILLT